MTRQPKKQIPVLLYRYEGPGRNIGYTLSPLYMDEQAQSKVVEEEMLFIYAEDFVPILEVLERYFPLEDMHRGEMMESFDHCFDNPISKAVWLSVLDELNLQTFEEPDLRSFMDRFVAWASKTLETADGIDVEGNL